MKISTLISILQKLDSPDAVIEMEGDDAQLAGIISVRVEYGTDGNPESVIIR